MNMVRMESQETETDDHTIHKTTTPSNNNTTHDDALLPSNRTIIFSTTSAKAIRLYIARPGMVTYLCPQPLLPSFPRLAKEVR
jgi:hypothetical protein